MCQLLTDITMPKMFIGDMVGRVEDDDSYGFLSKSRESRPRAAKLLPGDAYCEVDDDEGGDADDGGGGGLQITHPRIRLVSHEEMDGIREERESRLERSRRRGMPDNPLKTPGSQRGGASREVEQLKPHNNPGEGEADRPAGPEAGERVLRSSRRQSTHYFNHIV